MIGRIEYTSCEDGIEGISGFQVRAMTQGIAAPLHSAVLRDSVYEPSAGAPSRPSDAELTTFPVAFGYAFAAEGIVVYQSRYSGRDYTGRWGNYFAQGLTLDHADRLPGLPIDLWDSPAWRSESLRSGELEPVSAHELLPGETAGVTPTAGFLASADRHQTLSRLLAVIRSVLESQRGRLVLIAEDSTSAALWVSAITRSLPHHLARLVSFTTYTSRPESHSALLAFTTPDVAVPTYGNYRTVDLRPSDGLNEVEVGDYERVVADLWLREDPLSLVQTAPTQSPLDPSELDHFVRCALLFERLPVEIEWREKTVLDGLEFAVRRSPTTLLQPWDKVIVATHDIGELHEIVRWSSVLREATARHAPVPGPLMQLFVRAAVQAIVNGAVDASMWLPPLEPVAQRDLADTIFAPALWREPSPQLQAWLARPDNRSVREATLDILSDWVESRQGFAAAAESLQVPAARAIVGLAGARPRLTLAAQLALAASDVLDPVEVLVAVSPAALRSEDEWPALASMLWPSEPPSVAQAEVLLDRLDRDTLARTGLVDDHLVQRLLDDSSTGLSTADYRLARRLGQIVAQDRTLLSEPNRKVVDLVALVGYLNSQPGYDEAIEKIRYGVRQQGGSVAQTLSAQFNTALVAWMLPLPWDEHHRALRQLFLPLDDAGRKRFEVYAGAAETELASAKPDQIAVWITAWRRLAVPDEENVTESGQQAASDLSVELLEHVLARGLQRASRRQLERVGQSRVAMLDASHPGDSFARWWPRWQERHARQGLLARLKFPKMGEGV